MTEDAHQVPGFDLPIPDELVTDLVLGLSASSRGKTKFDSPIELSLVRALTSEDLQQIEAAPPAASGKQSLRSIRHSHHQLAQLLAQGREQEEIALVTGYSPNYITVIKRDPTFQELIAYYSTERKAIFVDTLERMKSLGISVLEELQQRIADEPEKWSNREMMEFAKLLLIEPERKVAGYAQQQGGAGGVSVTVNFVTPPDREAIGPVIEGALA